MWAPPCLALAIYTPFFDLSPRNAVSRPGKNVEGGGVDATSWKRPRLVLRPAEAEPESE